jgi:DNA-directed RNA polymerase subunit RPC12/RpoP
MLAQSPRRVRLSLLALAVLFGLFWVVDDPLISHADHIWTCSKCGKAVGTGASPPQDIHCPYCGVRFEFNQYPDGKVTNHETFLAPAHPLYMVLIMGGILLLALAVFLARRKQASRADETGRKPRARRRRPVRDEDDDDRPRRRRPSEDEDEPPRRRRPVAEDEDEPPRRRRPVAEDEDEPPRRRRTLAEAEDEPPRRRPRREVDDPRDDDDAPPRRRPRRPEE